MAQLAPVTKGGKSIGNGAKWATGATLAKSASQALIFLICARVCDRQEFVIITLASSFYTILQIFSDIGVGNFVIKQKSPQVAQLKAAFTSSLAVGISLSALAFLLREKISGFYGRAGLGEVVAIMSTCFMISPFWQIAKGLLERDLNFRPTSMAEIIGSLLGLLMATIGVFGGLGVYAIAIYALVFNLSLWLLLRRHALTLYSLPEHHSRHTWQDALSHGISSFGFNLTNSLTTHGDVLIGARVIAGSGIGAYAAAKEISLKAALFINPIMTRLSTPVIAAAGRGEGGLSPLYARLCDICMAVNAPIYCFQIFFTEQFCTIFFGHKWRDELFVFGVMGIWGLIRSFGSPVGSLLFGLGHQRLAFTFSFFTLLGFLPLYYFGSRHGAQGLAFGALAAMGLQQIFPIWFFIVRPLSGLSYTSYMVRFVRPVLVAVAASATLMGVAKIWPLHGDAVLPALITGVAFGLLYAAYSWLFNRPVLLVLMPGATKAKASP